jgi:hypothetical protein
MKLANTRLKKILLSIGIVLISIVAIIIICISPITKYLVEKYSVKYTGRQIKMDWAYVNPFTGYLFFKNLKINEYQSDSIFLSATDLKVNISLTKLFSKTFEIEEITLDQPKGIIIQNQKDINFSDLIERFSPKKSDTSSSTFHINILNWIINDGVLCYRDNRIPINYSVISLNIESPGLKWNTDTLAAKISLLSGNGGGSIKGNITINLKNLDYKLDAVINKLELKFLEQYFKQISNYGSFRANLDADIKANGSFKDAENMNAKGLVSVNDFHFGETPSKDFASFEKFTLLVSALNPKNKIYQLDSVSLTHPYFKYEQYDYLDNVEMMFGKDGVLASNVKQNQEKFNLILVIGDYIKALARNFLRSDYKVNRLAIYRGDLKYNDYSLNEEFSIDADPVTITADSINKSNSRIKLFFKSGIKPYGYASVNLSINPKDSSDFDLTYNLQKLPITMFNPYLITYTSFPFDRGTIGVDGVWKVRSGIIQSQNHLLMIDPRVAKREKNKGNKWIPMWLAMFFIRDRANVTDYQIPITGNLKSPKFHLHDIVFSTLRNIFVKPPTSPYLIEVKTQEREIEKSLIMKWGMRQSIMSRIQKKFATKMVQFLTENQSASIIISPQHYEVREEEYILFFEAKKKYYLSLNPEKSQTLNEGDSIYVDKMSIKDSLFVHYLNKHLTHSLIFTIQGKCSNLIGYSLVNTRFNQLNEARKNTFLSYFNEKGLSKRVIFSPSYNTIPYDGFSYYKIEYKGEFPDYLTEAYRKMEELNGRAPREKYNKERKKIKLSLN